MRIVYSCVLLVVLSATAFGSHLDPTEPPGSLLVFRGGLEWVWASPVAPDGSFGASPVIDLHHGFGLPSVADWLASFTGLLDLYDAFNPPSGQLCGSPYFNSGLDHCDAGDILLGGVWGHPFPTPDFRFDHGAETFLARAPDGRVPEPGTLALLAIGLTALATTKRSRSA